jgi:hypothetical protein
MFKGSVANRGEWERRRDFWWENMEHGEDFKKTEG